MKMKQQVIFATIFALSAVSPALRADTITLYQDAYSYPNPIGNSGGEFNAITSPTSYTGNYSPETALNVGYGLGFETFCVQVGIEFNVGQTYNYTLSQNMALNAYTPGTIPLNLGTAYLYYLFATGSPLLGYDFTDPSTRYTDAGLFQSAIWYLEGGQTSSLDPFSPSNPYYLLATSAFGTNVMAPSDGAYGVSFMVLTDANGNIAQNQLVYTGTSVPDGGSTILLLGFGFAGLAAIGFNLRKPAA